MSSALQIAATGVNAARTQLDVAAHNVANLETAGFRRQTTVQSTQPGGGVTTSVRRSPRVGAELETDVVQQLQAGHRALANLAVFRAADRMTGSLLDVEA